MKDNALTPEELDRLFAMYPLAQMLLFDDVSDPKGLRPVTDELEGLNFKGHKAWCEHTTFEYSQVKLTLKQLQHISNDDLYGACYAYNNMPFFKTPFKQWAILREEHFVKILNDKEGYHYEFDLGNGNVILYIYRRQVSGEQAAVSQFLLQKEYAIPLYFHPKHWANGKTLHQLGYATPNFTVLSNILSFIYKNDVDEVTSWYNNMTFLEVNLYDYKTFNGILIDRCQEHKLDLNNFL